MKKIIFTLSILMLIPMISLAWDDCPYGEIDCPDPGECSRYIDTDNDGICDHSQPAPADRETGGESGEETDLDLSGEGRELNDSYELATNKDLEIKDQQVQEVVTEVVNEKKSGRSYHLLPISLILIVLYIISHILSKKKVISVINHRKFWNILLLITFLASGISGILLVIKVNFGIVISAPFNMLFFHVETGIAMAVISIFHIIWHWAYFKSFVKFKK
jgi:uncharacterized integral membrane protein